MNGKTAGYNYESTMERCRQIENKGIEVRMFWECEVELLLKNDREMKLFYAQIQDNSTVIDLRETFSGGRVGPFTLKCDLSEILVLWTITLFVVLTLLVYILQQIMNARYTYELCAISYGFFELSTGTS